MPRISPAVAVALLLAAEPALALDCPLVGAVYTALDADDDMSADVGVPNSWEITHEAREGGPSDRPWVVRVAENRQKLFAEFAVAHPPGFGGSHVFMVRPPKPTGKRLPTDAPSATLYYFGDDLRRIDPAGEGEAKAPPYLQLPGLSRSFWDWKRDGRSFVPPDGIWKLTACRR